jgi:hypothetical protein
VSQKNAEIADLFEEECARRPGLCPVCSTPGVDYERFGPSIVRKACSLCGKPTFFRTTGAHANLPFVRNRSL